MLALATLIQERVASGKPRIHLAVTGPMTNIALFVKAFPHLLGGIEQIVCMAGAAGVKGNRGPLAGELCEAPSLCPTRERANGATASVHRIQRLGRPRGDKDCL